MLLIYIKRFQFIKSFKQIFINTINAYSDQQIKQSKNKLTSKYFYLFYFVQKIIISTLFAILLSLKFINCIIAGFNLIIIALIITFKPNKYQAKLKLNQNQKLQSNTLSLIKPNIRQILNYLFLFIIQILFFITNQIQQNSFTLYIPLIIVCILFLQIALTIYFLIKDGVIKHDITQLKTIFNSQKQVNQQQNQTERKIDPNQIILQLFKRNNKSPHNKNQFDQYGQKRELKSDHIAQKKYESSKNDKIDYVNYLQNLNKQKPQQNLTIDQMLILMAQKNHVKQMNNNATQVPKQFSNTNSKLKTHKQIFGNSKKNISGKEKTSNLNSFTLNQWNNLQNVDSSRMDKLIDFNKKRNQGIQSYK